MNIKLHDWRVVCVEDSKGPQLRLAGRGEDDGKYRVSSMLVSFDEVTREAETASGKRYELQGPPGRTEKIRSVIEAYRRHHGMVIVRTVREQDVADLFQLQATQLCDDSSLSPWAVCS